MNKKPWHPARIAALAANEKHYFSDVPCSRGHLAPRMVKYDKCTRCHLESQRDWRAKNPEKVKAFCKNWKANNKEFCTEYSKKWRADNPEAYSRQQAAKYLRNVESVRIYRKQYYAENANKFKTWSNRRRARVRAAEGTHTAAEAQDIFHLQKGRCAYCKIDLRKMPPAKRHLDHIVSLSKGGTNDRRNLQFLCPTCNNRKHTTDPIVFAQKLGMLL